MEIPIGIHNAGTLMDISIHLHLHIGEKEMFSGPVGLIAIGVSMNMRNVSRRVAFGLWNDVIVHGYYYIISPFDKSMCILMRVGFSSAVL